jgi:DNA repair exonuclease SbcCD nuclease subunit
MRFMHLSDLHIGYQFKNASFKAPSLFAKRSIELIETFYDALNQAKKEALDFILLTGDLFDHAFVSPRLIESVFDALKAVGIPIYITVGNHDVFLQNDAYKKLKTLEHIHFFSVEKPIYKLEDIEIAGINTKDFSKETLKTITSNLSQDTKHILCLHGDVYNKQDDYFLLSPNDLLTYPYDYIALGHIHKQDFLAPHIAYSGNIEPFDFSETGPKGVIIGDLDKQSFTFKKLAKRAYHVKNISVEKEDTLEIIKHKIHQGFSPHEKSTDFNRVILNGRLNRFVTIDDLFIEALKEDFYYLEVVVKTEKDYDLDHLKKTYKDTIIELIIDRYDPMKDNIDALNLALDELLKTEEGYFDH